MTYTLDVLDVNGMSGNESDGVLDGVRRCSLYWLDPILAAYWDMVTQAMNEAAQLLLQPGPRSQGNISRPVHEGVIESTRAPMHGLPSNWYDQIWFEGLRISERIRLKAAKPQPFPTFVCDFSDALAAE